MNINYAYQDNQYTYLRFVASDGKREMWLAGELRCIADPVTTDQHWPAMWCAELRCSSANIDANPKDHRSHSVVHQETSCHRAELAEWLTGELLARLPKE